MKNSFIARRSPLLLSIALLTSVTPIAAQVPSSRQNSDQQAGTQPQVQELSRAEFEKLLQHPKDLLIVDVRRPDELASIGGFPAYLSIQPADIESHLDWIPKDRVIVTVSNHAARSGRAATLLKSKGFKVAGTVGAQTYEEAGGKLTKVAPPPKKDAPAASVTKS